MANVYIISLGCDKNRIDAEIMARRLVDGGHSVTASLEQADCALVNTCGFIESAKKEAIDNIFDMVREKQSGNLKAVVVTGCLAQRYKDELCELIPEIDAAVGLAHNADICEVIEQTLGGAKLRKFGRCEDLAIEGQRLLSTPQHYAYLKIAEGCSNHCTYCAIPSIRGAFRSREPQAVIDEAKTLVSYGVRELILIAQDTTSYGADLPSRPTLASLLRELCGIDGLWRIRILYAYPERITDELIEVMASQPKVAKYLDIPFQHANAPVLKRMGRKGSATEYLSLIGRLRAVMPDVTLRSTFIVGFPGETEEQFCELLDFLRAARLDRAGCFEFSCEEGTAAEKLTPQLDDDVKHERAQRFELVQSEIMQQKLASAAGRVVEVICDDFDMAREMFACRGDADAPEVDSCVWLDAKSDLMPGEVYKVMLDGFSGDGVAAHII